MRQRSARAFLCEPRVLAELALHLQASGKGRQKSEGLRFAPTEESSALMMKVETEGARSNERDGLAVPAHAKPAFKYDGFVSYSHAVDGKLAPAIQRALHTLGKPWYRVRALHIFRDETSLSANPALWISIEKSLGASKWFIYLASARAAESSWVRREIEWWLSRRGPSSMLVVLTEGTLRWDDAEKAFDWSASDAFPRELAHYLTGEPLWIDLSWARNIDNLNLRHSRFRACMLRLAAPMHGRAPDELDGDDVRQYRRNRLTAKAAIVALGGLTVASLTAAYFAVQRGRESLSRELAMHSLQQLEANPELSLRLALEALDSAATRQAEEALRRALGESSVLATLPTPGQASAAMYSSTGRTILAVSYSDVALWKQGSGTMPILHHPQIVSVAQFSSDGAQVATGSRDGKARVWDVASAQLLAEWQAVEPTTGASQQPMVTHLRLSPDSSLALSAGGAPLTIATTIARVWEAKTGRLVSELKGHTSTIAALEFAPDGKRAVTGSWDKTVRIWDTATGALLKTLTGHEDAVTAVAFSHDGAWVISAGLDLTVRSWDATTGAQRAIGGNPKRAKRSTLDRFAAIGPRASRAITHDAASTTVYDPYTGKAVRELTDFPASCTKAVFSSDDRRLACPGEEGRAFVWDVDSGRQVGIVRGHRGVLNDLSFSPDGAVLLTAGTDNTVRAWSLDRNEWTLAGHEKGVHVATWSPDGSVVATGSVDGTARLWDARTGRLLSLLRTPESELATGEVASIAFSQDGHRLLVGSFGVGGAHVWDARAGTPMLSLDTDEMKPTLADASDWTADDSVIIMGAAQDPVLLRMRKALPDLPPFDPSRPPASLPSVRRDLLRWDARSGRILPPIPAGTGSEFGPVTCGYSRAAGLACVATDQDTVSQIWDVRSRVLVSEIRGHLPDAPIAKMSADGDLVALSDQDRVEIWETRTGRLRSRIAALTNYTITDLDFDPTGRRLLTAGGQLEPVARIWDTSSGHRVADLRGHTHSINRVRFSPDGRLVVTASQDNSARIWSVEDGRELMSLRGHRAMLHDARFSPDGRSVLTASGDGTARIYDVSLARPLPELLETARMRRARSLTAEETRRFLHEPGGSIMQAMESFVRALNRFRDKPPTRSVSSIHTLTREFDEMKAKAAREQPHRPTAYVVLEEAVKKSNASLARETNLTKKADEAANQFLGFYLVNTKALAEHCRRLGVDIAAFVQAFAGEHAALYQKSRQIHDRDPDGADKMEAEVYRALEPQLDQMMADSMKAAAQQYGASEQQVCQAIADHPKEMASQFTLAKVNPGLHQALTEAR